MTDEKIIEYVMNSPENTNPSVLDSMLKSNKVQPDWNQNDSTAGDYIKNRPFYEETTEIEMLSETSFEVGEIPEIFLSDSFPYTFEVGKDYIVTLDGETKTYTAQLVEYIGAAILSANLEEISGGNGWYIFIMNSQLGIATSDSSFRGTHTIKINYPTTVVRKIDSKYIDESSIASSIGLSSKMDKTNPVCEGSFSLNRREGTVVGEWSFAEGQDTEASGSRSHAEGGATLASGDWSHAEGFGTAASGAYSHAEGQDTTASGKISHAEGLYTIAASQYQHVQGKNNIKDSKSVYAHIIGGGKSPTNRKNIHTVDWSGNAWYEGTVEGKALILASSTTGSTKRFKVTVDDTGVLTATEVTS